RIGDLCSATIRSRLNPGTRSLPRAFLCYPFSNRNHHPKERGWPQSGFPNSTLRRSRFFLLEWYSEIPRIRHGKIVRKVDSGLGTRCGLSKDCQKDQIEAS